jgi:hypothetical protein
MRSMPSPFTDSQQVSGPLYASADRIARRTSALHHARVTGRHAAEVIADLAAEAAGPSAGVVVDLGCGRGTITGLLAQRLLGYDLAKLIVTLAMAHGPIPAPDIATALSAYNAATARHYEALPSVTWDELMNWAEIHHILTSRYAADGRYPHRWDQVRPATPPRRDRTWP